MGMNGWEIDEQGWVGKSIGMDGCRTVREDGWDIDGYGCLWLSIGWVVSAIITQVAQSVIQNLEDNRRVIKRLVPLTRSAEERRTTQSVVDWLTERLID